MRRFAVLMFFFLMLAAAAGCPRASTVPGGPAESPWFEDITERVGLKFHHDSGPADSAYFMPCITAGGGAVLDYDGDGKLDLYLIHNGGPKGKRNQLFHHEANGTFRDVSAVSGLDAAGWGQGAAVGDVNNDGWPDLALSEYGATRLFLNEGGASSANSGATRASTIPSGAHRWPSSITTATAGSTWWCAIM